MWALIVAGLLCPWPALSLGGFKLETLLEAALAMHILRVLA